MEKNVVKIYHDYSKDCNLLKNNPGKFWEYSENVSKNLEKLG